MAFRNTLNPRTNMKAKHLLSDRTLSLLLCAFLPACVQAQPAYTELISPDARSGGQFGTAYGELPDLTRDGVGEFYVFGNNRVYVYNGTTVELLYSLSAAGCGIGIPTASAGDLNNDGISDLMLAKRCGTSLIGSVDFVDGPTGQLLFTIESPDPITQGFFGGTLRLLPDITGDGRDDWLIHQREFQLRAGRVYIFDSETRQVVRTIRNTEAEYNFWMEKLEVIPDVDQGGTPELLIGSMNASVSRGGQTLNNAGRAIVRSLQTGAVLYELLDPEPQAEDFFGFALSGIGDITGDAIGDIAVSSFTADRSGAIDFFSGTDGKWLRTLRAPNPQAGGRFAWRIESLPDLNADGVPELLSQEIGLGKTYLYDGATSALLKTIQFPGPVGSTFSTGTVRQQAPSEIRAYLFAAFNVGDSGRVYYMPFTPIQPTQLWTVGKTPSGFHLRVTGEPGLNLQLQATSDFNTWDPVAVLTTGTEPIDVVDSAPPQAQRFYRAAQR